MSKRLKLAIDFFEQKGHSIVIAIVPKFRGHENQVINKIPTVDLEILDELHKLGKVTYSPGQVHDDREILDQAIALKAVVVSCDRYKEFEQEEKYAEFLKNRQYK